MKNYLIKQITENEIENCVSIIRESFSDVAERFNITKENAPNYVLFSTNKEKLKNQFASGRLMYALYTENKIVGYYSLESKGSECEINNLCVLPEYRHMNLGTDLLNHAVSKAKELGADKISISIVEENTLLKKWYESFGFVHKYIKKYDFFPFTCGYMEYLIRD